MILKGIERCLECTKCYIKQIEIKLAYLYRNQGSDLERQCDL